MAFIKIYEFDTLEEANDIIDLLNVMKGFPTADGSTLTYCKAENVGDKWRIPHDEFIQSVVGYPPLEIEVIQTNPFNEL